MVDDPRKPRSTPSSRATTASDRDRLVPKHDREPHFVADDVTGRYEGEELARVRARRPTDERIAILERKSDVLDARIDAIDDKVDTLDGKVDALDGKVDAIGNKTNEVAVSVAGIGGQLSIMPRLVDAMEKATVELHRRDHVTFTAKVDLDKARELDEIDAKKDQRARDSKLIVERNAQITKLLAILGGIGTAIATAIAAGNC